MNEMDLLDLIKAIKLSTTEVGVDEEKPKKERVEYKHIRTDYVDITCRIPANASTVRTIEKDYPDCNFDNAILSHLLTDSLVLLGSEIYKNGNESDKDQFKKTILGILFFMTINGWLQ